MYYSTYNTCTINVILHPQHGAAHFTLLAFLVGVVLLSPNNSHPSHFNGVHAFSPNSSSLSPHVGIRPELSKESHAYRSAEGVNIEIKLASEEKGLGVFATSNISQGTLLGNYTGEVLTIKQVQARFWGKCECDESDLSWGKSRLERGQSVTGHYLFELPNGSFVDAEDAEVSSWCRFMNHAEESSEGCNVKAFIQSTIGGEVMKFPLMYAIEDIKKVSLQFKLNDVDVFDALFLDRHINCHVCAKGVERKKYAYPLLFILLLRIT